jgi:adenylate kinase family enzyme
MKIVIIGDAATGKSTFAARLGSILNLSVIHLDELMFEIGKKDKKAITEGIKSEVDKKSWIIEGNAFTKDPDYRIKNADKIYVFDFHRVRSFFNHLKRSTRIKLGLEKPKGGNTGYLNLKYYVPYIFTKFPKRKYSAVELARAHGKKIIVFRSRKEVNKYLVEMEKEPHQKLTPQPL